MTPAGGPGPSSPAGSHRHRPGPPPDRLLNRHTDGRLYDVRLHEPVTPDELAQEVRAGHTFAVRDHHTGTDCTYQVLAQVMAHALGATVQAAAQHTGNPAGLLTALAHSTAPAPPEHTNRSCHPPRL
ncbi:polyhydroxyalkanoate synthesis regulator DNA-binding domain-containing protein [Streptomyces sp. WAC 06783]|uniref:polyhydroxyalkanoate synthesis regulator DNA-binding domain-containing protein n=1 Tax=Streptomyces sp. WAC 06783 TaxID=2203211 RepID=UPI00163C79C4|nr:polyhydroxyalkanoate synthesis regulator DNA-binding domain-containing protein [Streptomyces sp. WAC 06783]